MTNMYLSPRKEILRRELIEDIIRAKLYLADHKPILGTLDFMSAQMRKELAGRLDAEIPKSRKRQQLDR